MDTLAIEAILHKTMGLNISSIGNTSLKNAINKRMSAVNIHNAREYSSFLKTTPEEINALIEEVSVTETWFFRDNLPFAAMVDYAKKIFRDKKLSRLKILSLPCATGEEPYSIAISLLEAGFLADSFEIDAVDINNRAMDIAKKAVYGNNSFRAKEKIYLREKYFRKVKKKYRLRDQVKETVQFHKGNLINLSLDGRNQLYHIIFCRNLLIYLNNEALDTAMQTLDKLLTPQGLLFVGHAEPGIFVNSVFSPSSYQKTFSLMRREDITPNIQKSKHLPDFMSDIALHVEASKVTAPIKQREPQGNSFDIDKMLAARLCLYKKQYIAAIALCKEYILENGPSCEAFFWLAKGLYKADEKNKAIDLLRRTIYLDPDHLSAMKLLGKIYKATKDEDNYKNIKKRISRVKIRLSR